jgi:DNA primase
MIPQPVIDTVLMRTDLVDLIGQYVPLKKRGASFIARCPFHQEKTPSFHVHPEKQFYHCFGCGAHGNAIGFLMAYERLDFLEALAKLAERGGVTLPNVSPNRQEAPDESKALYTILEKAALFYEEALNQNKQAQAYLSSRGIDKLTQRRYRLGFAPAPAQHLLDVFPGQALLLAKAGLWHEEGKRCRFRQRIVFPIRTRKGIVAFGGRILGPGEPKYLNSPESPLFHKGQIFYGLQEALEGIRSKKRVVVVEGYLDCLMLSQHGFLETIATMGTAMGETALEQLFRVTDTVYFCFDGDTAGQKAAQRAMAIAMQTMRDGQEAWFALLPTGEDPDSFVRKHGALAFEQVLAKAIPLSRFFLSGLAQCGEEEKKAQWLKQNASLLQKVKNKTFGILLWQKIAQALGLPIEMLEAAMDGKSAVAFKARKTMPTAQSAKDPLLFDKTLVRLSAFLRLFPAGCTWLQDIEFSAASPEETALLQGIHALKKGQAWPAEPYPIYLAVEKLMQEIQAKHVDVQQELKHLVQQLQKKPLLARFNHLSQKPWNTLTQEERLELQSLQKTIK